MAKLVDDTVLDAALEFIQDNAVLLTVCSATPTDYEDATDTNMLAQVVISDADFGIGPGATGRKITVAEQADIEVEVTDDAEYICLCSADTLLFATTCTSQTLTDGNTVTVPEWTITLGDPT